MVDLLLRGLDPDLKQRLTERARQNGSSLSAEALALLAAALLPPEADAIGSAMVAAFRGADEDSAVEASASP